MQREQVRQAGQAFARVDRALAALGEVDQIVAAGVTTTGERQVTTARNGALDRLAGAEIVAAHAAKDRDAAHADLAVLKRELDRRSADVLSPFGDAIARATAEQAGIQGRLEMLERLREPHQRVAGMRDHTGGLAEQIAELTRQRDALIRETAVASDLFNDLDERFAHVTKGLKLPWFSGRARVDRETYLPLVDQQQFQQVSHGIRSALSVGYSVALLRYALDLGTTSLPSLLVIDSPKKNVGNGEYDSALAHRIYANFLEYDDSRSQMGTFAGKAKFGSTHSRGYQVILVNNDLPEEISNSIIEMPMTHEQPFIPGVANAHVDEDSAATDVESSVDDDQ
ncbi:hypothetical protein F0L68_05455 [Solihabitans fulvus]|uniref:Uncharacterized protein n=1 Tax=Solihabitans fulvus TaxID=1892852 RepID=A0A5B2XN14_9PSEU|nr:hypothetical protein [Solihabitans fulvus]KAA2265107.1 hypothetical protein F0L68_05455 [Solihabitans fulvus]